MNQNKNILSAFIKKVACFFISFFWLINLQAQCEQGYFWAVWDNFTGNSANGTITLPSGTVGVTMTANYQFDSTPSIFGYGAFSGFGNAPPNATVPRTTWAAGQGGETTMCFSETVNNPVLLLASLGSPSIIVTLTFSKPYQVLFDGGGMTYPNDLTIIGQEGYAIIVFPGEFDCVTIFSNTPEYWTNITWGLNPHLFEVEITGDPTGCGEATVTATGGEYYQWSGGQQPQEATNTFTESGNYFLTVTDAQGCTVLTSVEIEIYPSHNVWISEEICEGDSLLFNGQYLATAGEYEANFTNQHGCDSIVHLSLAILPISHESILAEICEGDYYWFDNVPLSEEGVYVQVLNNIYGCDSVTTLMLRVLPHYESYIEQTICEGETFYFNDLVLTEPGLYSTNFFSYFGCDSIVLLQLNVTLKDTFLVDVEICEGDSLSFNGEILKLAGRYESIFQTANGCDSLVILSLEVLQGSESTLNIDLCRGDSLVFGDDTIRNSGNYTLRLLNFRGCDSIVILTVNELPSYDIGLPIEICSGDTLVFEGYAYTEAGIYRVVLSSELGCDSVIAIDLSVKDTDMIVIDTSICSGDSIYFNQSFIKDSGRYQMKFQNLNGCDSTVILNLGLWPNYENVEEVTICQGHTYTWQGNQWDATGTYTVEYSTTRGCDSLFRLHLQVVDLVKSELTVNLCEGESYFFGGNYIEQSGIYFDTLVAAWGCDSIVELQLTILPAEFQVIEDYYCEGSAYFFVDEWLDAPGEYHKLLSTDMGCDSTLILHLREQPRKDTLIHVQICSGSGYQFFDRFLTDPGRYEKLLQSSRGCDSLIVLNLEVAETILSELELSICEGDTYILGGDTLTKPGLYRDTLTSIGGCDSIISLTLDWLPLAITDIDAKICQGDYYIFDNDTLRESGTYNRFFTSQHGCDSILRLNLLIIDHFYQRDHVETCDAEYTWPVTGKKYEQSGLYMAHYFSSNGCDSIYTLEIEFLPSYLMADTVHARRSYRWPVNDEIYQRSGTYYVKFLSESGCDSTHVLYLFLKEGISIYAPSAFTPNSDGINDRFTLFGDQDLLRILSLQIFDRWGNHLASYVDLPPNDPSYGWDGRKGNMMLDPGVFIYTAELLLEGDEKIHVSGEVQLLR